MTKLTLTDIINTESTSLVSAVNNNNAVIVAALENTLSRDGSTPNQMGADLDMNSNSVINLPTPLLASEATNKQYVDNLVNTLNADKLDEAVAAYESVITLHDETQALRDEAEGFRDDAASFVGAAVSAQTLSTPRTFSVTGATSGTSSAWNGSTNLSITTTLSDDVVTNTKLANMATSRIKGRLTAGTGDPEDLTGSQVTGLLDVFNSSTKGVVTNSGTSNTTDFLRRDGNWAAPPSYTLPSASSYSSSDETQIGTLKLKWGDATTVSGSEGNNTIVFTTPFPNECVKVLVVPWNISYSTSYDALVQMTSRSTSSFTFYLQGDSASPGQMKVSWLAWGY